MTFREFLTWQEQEVKGIKAFEPGAKVPAGIEIPKTGFRKGGARTMRMTSAVNPAKPIFRKAGSTRSQPMSGIANK